MAWLLVEIGDRYGWRWLSAFRALCLGRVRLQAGPGSVTDATAADGAALERAAAELRTE